SCACRSATRRPAPADTARNPPRRRRWRAACSRQPHRPRSTPAARGRAARRRRARSRRCSADPRGGNLPWTNVLPERRCTLVRSPLMLKGNRRIGRLWSVAVTVGVMAVGPSAAHAAPAWHVDPAFGTGGIESLNYGDLGRPDVGASFIPGANGLYWVLGL